MPMASSLPNPARRNAITVASINEEIRLLAQQMLQTMYSADGIGLAAPQVGVNKRLIVVDLERVTMIRLMLRWLTQ
ncbi:MAG: peptide deformylase [Anaerolineae bacterium]|nr:peptide deformylase [Gloeobacterales cyanobacterium ES-bin-313]